MVDSAEESCFKDEKVFQKDTKRYIEPNSEISLCSTTNHCFVLTEMTKLYKRIRRAIFPFYFGFVSNLPPNRLIETSFIDENIKEIVRTKALIQQINSPTVPILELNNEEVLAIKQRNLQNNDRGFETNKIEEGNYCTHDKDTFTYESKNRCFVLALN